jgi:glutamyl-tRNA synthetase
LHLGHARSFLLAWWQVRAAGGRCLLRLEDLDRSRVRPGMAQACLRDLEWLGLDWDGPVVVQSEGLAHLRGALDALLAAGALYPCVCTRREIREAASAPHDEGGAAPYPGTCRDRFASLDQARAHSGGRAALRLRVAPGPVPFTDGVLGPQAMDVAAEVGDFPVAGPDGLVAYQLAVVVDDARSGIDTVLRADDLLGSTARQLLLQRALGLPSPRWFHVPLVCGPDGARLAKRADDLSLAALRAGGVDPREVVAWAARSAGLPCPEPLAAAELIGVFDLSALPAGPVSIDPAAWDRSPA